MSAAFGGSGREWQETIGIVMAVAAVVFLVIVIRPSLFGAPGRAVSVSAGSALAAAMEQECLGAVTELTRHQGTNNLDPQIAALQAQAQQVERAILDTRRAIEVDDSDPRMLTSLARLCRVKLRLTEQAQELARSWGPNSSAAQMTTGEM